MSKKKSKLIEFILDSIWTIFNCCDSGVNGETFHCSGTKLRLQIETRKFLVGY